jgi:serine/threonine-protein kinase
MGVVFEVLSPAGDRRLALKMMQLPPGVDPDSLGVRSLRARFHREIEALSWLNHPNIVALYDHGLFENEPYYVMELLEGPTLREDQHVRGALPPAECLRIMDELLDGVQAAHRVGIVHRDLKPANIVLHGPARQVKITDFGVAKMATDAAQAGVGENVGTVAYMCPQLLRGEEVDVEADVFACGVILHRIVTNLRPFEGVDKEEIKQRILQGKPEISPYLPPGLAAIIRTALEEDPGARYPDAESLRQALADWAATPEGQAFAALPQLPLPPNPLEDGCRKLREGDVKAALSLLQQAVLSEPHNFRAQFYLGVACLRSHYFDAAAATLEEACRINPDQPSCLLNLCLAYRGLGDLEQARQFCQRALQLYPDYEEARRLLEELE